MNIYYKVKVKLISWIEVAWLAQFSFVNAQIYMNNGMGMMDIL